MFCLGCGDDLSGKESDRRNLKSSQDVLLLWKAFVDRLSVDSLSINIDSYASDAAFSTSRTSILFN